MRSEIGSEFWDIPTGGQNRLFPDNTQWFLSGRSALQTIIEKADTKTAALPSWCCGSMIKPFLDAGVKVSFYPVYMDGGLAQDLSCVDAEAILVMDYFGYTGEVDLTGFSGTVIRDVTHSLLSKTYNDAHYYFGSLRKWAGFWTGGYGWGFECGVPPVDDAYVVMRKAAMETKAQYISGKITHKDYLRVFGEAEEHLEQSHPTAAAARDMELASKLDVDLIKSRRRANAARLLEAFSDIAVFPAMEAADCPLFVPILVPDGKRDALRRYLIEREIYCPAHWPVSAYHSLDGKTRQLYTDELSLVCDQRYTLEDMERMIEAIREFWKR